MNIVVVGAHPDDPESGCGGLAVRAVEDGHRVIFLYLSSGVPGRLVCGRPEDELREEEARKACSVIGAEPHFMRFPTPDIPFNLASLERVSDFMRDVDADLVLAHWPVDTHPDHQAAGVLVTQAVVGNPDVALAYYEVVTGVQTIGFEPNRFVDISSVASLKRKAVGCHMSQNVGSWWHYHDIMERLRGAQMGVERAEGYYLVVATPKAESLFSARRFLEPSGSRTLRRAKHERVPLSPHRTG